MKLNYKNILHYLTLLFSIFLLATLTGCPRGNITGYNNTDASGIYTDGINLVATAVKNTAPISECPSGGITVNTGIDTNGNKVLDSSEIISTQYVCNGASGNDLTKLVRITEEPAGTHCSIGGSVVYAGRDANNNEMLDVDETKSTGYMCDDNHHHHGHHGHNVLVSVVPVTDVAICAYGGNKINIGVDTNSNDILDPKEITSSNYACNGAPGETGQPGVPGLVLITDLAPQDQNCPTGGKLVTAGQDFNLNGTLEAGEITSTAKICNGLNGFNSLVSIVPVDPGLDSNCPNGGNMITSGLDNNPANGVLDDTEVSATRYVCNGAPGAKGDTGAGVLVTISNYSGDLCPSTGGKLITSYRDINNNGTIDTEDTTVSTAYICNGANGSDGFNSLVSIVTVNPGDPICPTGGKIINSGLDTNRNGSLDQDPNEITASNYVCNGETGPQGPPGPGITWIIVNDPPVEQALSNKGYMASNPAHQVTITLPASAPLAIGDIVQVTGVGAGGWKVAQNEGQSIITKDMFGSIGTSWTARMTDVQRDWRGVASSADGNKLLASAANGFLYTSTDSGLTWTARMTDATREWRGVASSADGNNLVAAVLGGPLGQLYTSTNSGVTWIAHDPAREWRAVASSADGSILVAAVSNGWIYTSINFGKDWSAVMTDALRDWRGVASSADGSKLLAAAYGGQLYTSTNFGVTWTARDSARGWQGVASSADGSKLLASVNGGQLYTSTDFGVTWTARDSARGWQGVASSADGSKLLASVNGGQLYTSTDFGMTWTARDAARGWQGVASSADGSKLVAAADGGILGDFLYTSSPIAFISSTTGLGGSILGAQYDAVDLQYIGSNTFMVRGFKGYLEVR